ncbi:glycosyltransferase family 4 protein [Sphingomonas flavalba]|uniref:glycosyltransferase family 4 protein n=1 Tax=Sphingomonas flavalba TaxID=2559804 RepID=UPI0039E0ABD1
MTQRTVVLPEIWFWQRILSPHMAGLAVELAARGHSVTYVAERPMSDDRAKQGWRPADTGAAQLRFAPDSAAMARLVAEVPEGAIHICQGFRGNGLISDARAALIKRGAKHWVIMETVDNSGWRGVLRRAAYRRLISRSQGHLAGILATGHATPAWLAKCGAPKERVFPFAYFLPGSMAPRLASPSLPEAPYRLLYVGALIERKRLDLLLAALGRLEDDAVELVIIGTGPLESRLRAQASAVAGGRVKWLGLQSMDAIPDHMVDADCLVLPSRHDGWGAVVSEALIAGTPAICSDRCGAAGVVRASGVGAVFTAGDEDALVAALNRVIAKGRISPEDRSSLAGWARCLGAMAGAEYLERILVLSSDEEGAVKPQAPWVVAAPTAIAGYSA